MKKLSNYIDKSPTLKKTGIVLFGTVISQALLIGSVPLLSRLYDVKDFGTLGMFMLISMLGIQLFSWRFDYGIVSSKTIDIALNLLALCIAASIISSLLFGLILNIFSAKITENTEFNVSKYGIFLIAYAFSYALWNAITFVNIKLAAFKLNAIFNILRASLTVLLSFIFTKTENGLIAGLVVAQIISTLVLSLFSINKRKGTSLHIDRFLPIHLKKVAFSNAALFKYSFPSAAIEIISGQLPQFFIGTFGPLIFGWFSQANRLLNAPLDLIGQSVRSVFWESASKQFLVQKNCIALFDTTLKKLFVVSIIPFITLFFISPWLFKVILGAEWENAGHFAKILIPLCFFRFLSNPLSSMFFIADKQKYDFTIQLSVLFVIGCLFFTDSFLVQKPDYAIGIYSFVYSMKYIAELYFSRKFAQNQIRNS